MIEILLIDDESYVTESLSLTIPWQRIGVRHVHVASSAMDALSIIENQSIDIVVTDIRMPEMDGLKLIEHIVERWPHIYCILLTGHSQFEYAKKAIQLQAFDYLLKPVDDEEFIEVITNAIESLKDEWEQAEKLHRLRYNHKSDFTVLRAKLMHDLLLGKRLSLRMIREKLAQYEIDFIVGDQSLMLLIQLGKPFTAMDHMSMSLIEYAIGNIAEEVFKAHCHVWSCKAPHQYLVVLISYRSPCKTDHSQLKGWVTDLQNHVSNYLKGDISIVISQSFRFPDDISKAYRAVLGSMFQLEQTQSRHVLFLDDEVQEQHMPHEALDRLYQPPTLIQLLDSKQWEAAKDKVNDVFTTLGQQTYVKSHLYEVFLYITNAFMYITHRQSHSIRLIDRSAIDVMLNETILSSVEQLRTWSLNLLQQLEKVLSSHEEHTKSYISRRVQEIVNSDLAKATSVKVIADRVYLHPVYLSKIYKAETGESLGDYIIRMRLERASYMLKHTNKKIYEITSELGYQNPQYFSKVFRKHFGLTPNEYRNQ